MPEQFITVVSGLPRSGTSMMMQLLDAGGMPILRDELRQADQDNPRGYYEFERVKQLAEDQAWLEEARGKAVKIISALLQRLPARYTYKVIFLERRMAEILASQKVMLVHRQEPTDKIGDDKMAQYFENHLVQVKKWLGEQPNISVLYVNYNDTLNDPRPHVERITRFLGLDLDQDKMMGVVDRALYREREKDQDK